MSRRSPRFIERENIQQAKEEFKCDACGDKEFISDNRNFTIYWACKNCRQIHINSSLYLPCHNCNKHKYYMAYGSVSMQIPERICCHYCDFFYKNKEQRVVQ